MSNEHHTLAGTTAIRYLKHGLHLVNGVFLCRGEGRISGKSCTGDALPYLRVETGSAADESAPAFVKAQKSMRGARDTDAAADSHAHAAIKVEILGVRGALRRDLAQPQRTRRTEINPIDAAIDVECLRQAARPASWQRPDS